MTEGKKYFRSVSQLKAYAGCGERFRLERMVRPRLPARPAAWTAVGTAFHSAYESWELEDRAGTIAERFGEHFDADIVTLTEQQPDYNLWQSTPRVKTVLRDIELRREAGLKMAETYETHCRSADWVLWYPDGEDFPALELGFEIDLDGVPVTGYIDTVLYWPKTDQVTIRDLKTGKMQETARQLGIYRVAMMELFDVDITFGEAWYTKLDKSSGFIDLRRYTREYVTEQYKALDAGIQGRVFLANPGDACELCSVRPWCREKGWLREDEPLNTEESNG